MEPTDLPTIDWPRELPMSVTVCDREGIILQMNEYSRKMFAAEGGADLIGTSLLDCHPEPSRSQLAEMLETHSKNIYRSRKTAS
jgi:hypothetical protein